jgi:uncharacterized protein (TIGR04255 family)
VIELRFPTYLRLKEKEPIDISEAIRDQFPIYDPSQQMQMTPLGTTDPQPIYRFTTRKKDLYLEVSSSNLVLVTKKYKSFEDLSSRVAFVIERCMPLLKTSFFTRVGMRYINNISGINPHGCDIMNWINQDLVKPVASSEIGTVNNMRNEFSGPLECGGNYIFRYGLSPTEEGERKFVMDWDYSQEDIEVDECMNLLNKFHDVHYPFFWWSLGEKAREALENGTASS